MNIVLFLGAGASVPYGKPTTADLRSIIFPTREPENGEIISNLMDIIFEVKNFVDIEYILRAWL